VKPSDLLCFINVLLMLVLLWSTWFICNISRELKAIHCLPDKAGHRAILHFPFWDIWLPDLYQPHPEMVYMPVRPQGASLWFVCWLAGQRAYDPWHTFAFLCTLHPMSMEWSEEGQNEGVLTHIFWYLHHRQPLSVIRLLLLLQSLFAVPVLLRVTTYLLP
jgi:hypothetical protein